MYDTNTAVFTCSSGSETDTIAMFDESKSGFAILGHNKAMQANRLSYVLNLNGEWTVPPIARTRTVRVSRR